ncbi:MAG: DUF2269 domain-containing protein [Magnetococcales bacterium]|nr:DUF2269 domain-containing protein [Magnetococcales bacterium]
MDYLVLKYIHIISATLLFGTGLGTAFQMVRAYFSHDVRAIAAVSRSVVLADWIFTAPAVVVQLVTGGWMMWLMDYPLMTGWLMAALILYVIVGVCWLPVVWLQIRMERMAAKAMTAGEALPPLYHRYFRIWFVLGWPAFLSVLVIFYLMVFKPEISI